MNFFGNYFFVACSQAVKVLLNGVSFFILARQLGVEDFGWFVAISAMCALVAPLIDMGLFQVNLRRYAKGECSGRLIGASMQTIFVMCIGAIPLAIFCAKILFEVDVGFVILISFELLFFEKIILVLNSFFSCEKRFKDYSRLEIFQSFVRMIVVVALLVFDGGKEMWGWLYFLNGFVVFSIGILWLRKIVKIEYSKWSDVFIRIKEGSAFLVATVFEVTMQEFDRLLVARLAGVTEAGIYGAVMRLNNMILIPINSYYITVNKDMYDLSEISKRWMDSLLLKVLLRSVLISIILSVFLLVALPFAVKVLGDGYSMIGDYVYLSVLLPIVYAFSQPLQEGLSARGFQKTRNIVVGIGLLMNVFLIAVLVPLYKTGGAIFAIVLSRFFVGVVSFLIVRRIS